MAAPTDPTATTLVQAALILSGIVVPSAAQIVTGKTYLERVKNDIWNRAVEGGNTQLKTLQTTGTLIGVIGQRRYALPTDFSEELAINILYGSTTGVAQGGAADSITFAADEDITEVDAVGKYVLMESGTSKGQYREAITYSATTKVAEISLGWDTSKTPVVGDVYRVIDDDHPTKEQHHTDLDSTTTPTSSIGKPDLYSKFNDEVYFDKPFKYKYGIRLRYYANLSKVDLTEGSTELITKIYRNWQTVLEQGIYKYSLLALDDDTYRQANIDYERMVDSLLDKEIAFGGEFEGFEI